MTSDGTTTGDAKKKKTESTGIGASVAIQVLTPTTTEAILDGTLTGDNRFAIGAEKAHKLIGEGWKEAAKVLEVGYGGGFGWGNAIGDSTLTHFLDLFHHRLLSLLAARALQPISNQDDDTERQDHPAADKHQAADHGPALRLLHQAR